MEFSGILSLENTGGFASIRSRPAKLGLDADDTVAVRLKGDGPRRRGWWRRGYSASAGRPTEIPSKGSRNAAQGPAAHAIGLDDAEFATEADV